MNMRVRICLEISYKNSGGGQYINHTFTKSTDTTKAHTNFHFRDIFGNYHYFFRPYITRTKNVTLRILPNAYIYTDRDLIFTESKKALISYTPFRAHPLELRVFFEQSKKNFLFKIISICKQWIMFHITTPLKINGSVAALGHPNTSMNYGHFIKDLMFEYHQLKLKSIKPDFYIFPCSLPFHKQMLEILGIPLSRVIPVKPNKLIYAKELIIPALIRHYEHIEYREHLHYRTISIPYIIKDIYRHIAPLPNPMRKIFLTRPKDSNRNITNLIEVEAILQDYGYEIILPDNLSLKEQMKLFSEIKVVVAVHGSGLDNMIFAQDNIVVFEIFSQYYHDNNPQLLALTKHCQYFYMVGETHDTSMHPQKENIYIPPHQLKEALTLIQKAILY